MNIMCIMELDKVNWKLFMLFFITCTKGSYDAEELFKACEDQEQVTECRLLDNKTLLCTDMIPEDPLGYEAVVIKWCSSRPDEEDLNISEELFTNMNWTFVKQFTYIKSQNIGFHTIIGPFAFKHLAGLETVRLHVLKSQLLLNRQSFCGVENLKSLNFSGSTYLQQYFITQIFFSDECMSDLEELSLSGISLHHDLDFDDDFLSRILRRPIRVLDLRFLHVRNLNVTTVANNCERLEYLYLSDTMFEKVDHGLPSERICPNLKVVDVSGAQFVFMKILCMVRYLGNTTSSVKADGDFQFLVHTETLFWDRLCTKPFDRTMALSIKSVKLDIETPSALRRLFIRNNNIDTFDADINWLSSNVEHLDLSNNSIGYLNPRFFSLGDKFRHVDLAGNRLSLMVKQSAEDFEKLLNPLVELRNLSLARNNITTLPKYTFLSNAKLEYLDLSQNLLSNITFSFEHLGNLTLLNLSENRIDFKDTKSQGLLNLYITMLHTHQTKWLDISKNPLSCNQSTDLSIISWLLKSKFSFYNWDKTKCSSENGSLVPINGDTLITVEEIHARPVQRMWVMLGSTLTTIVISACYYKYKYMVKNKQIKRAEENRLDLLRQKAAGHEFAVFVSYSSDDKDFVKEYIYDQLNEALKTKTDIDRELVFMSEIHMKAGSIKDGIRDGLDRSTVMLFLLTDSIVESQWCLFEFKEAFDLEKPIVLMVKDMVNEDRLPENIKNFFLRNTRIIWKSDENGEYSLETTWENVCSSVMSA